jgi:hypothetical protein
LKFHAPLERQFLVNVLEIFLINGENKARQSRMICQDPFATLGPFEPSHINPGPGEANSRATH